MAYDNSKKLVDKTSLSLYTQKLLETLDNRFNSKIEIIEGAPTIVPQSIGELRVDEKNKVLYVSVGTKSPSDWMTVNTPDDLEFALESDIDNFLDEI